MVTINPINTRRTNPLTYICKDTLVYVKMFPQQLQVFCLPLVSSKLQFFQLRFITLCKNSSPSCVKKTLEKQKTVLCYVVLGGITLYLVRRVHDSIEIKL